MTLVDVVFPRAVALLVVMLAVEWLALVALVLAVVWLALVFVMLAVARSNVWLALVQVMLAVSRLALAQVMLAQVPHADDAGTNPNPAASPARASSGQCAACSPSLHRS